MTTASRRRSSEVPTSGTWVLDPGHADIGFWGRHFMLTKVRGRFTGVSAQVFIGDDPTDTQIEATIEMASVDSGDRTRDDHLRSEDLFDVASWPEAHFRSTSVEWDETTGVLVGELTIKGVTLPVRLDVELIGTVRDPWGSDRAVFSASSVIDRTDWGIDWNMPLDSGGLLVSKEIHLEFHAELVRQG